MIRCAGLLSTRGIVFESILIGLLAGTLALASCSGSDGATGPQGPPGPPGSGDDTQLDPDEDAPGLHVEIVSLAGASGADGTFQVGDTISVTFALTKDDGSAWLLSEMAQGRMLVSGPSFNYQRVLPQVSDVPTTSVDNGDGTYTYTFADPIPAVYEAPYGGTTDTGAYNDTHGELTGQALLAGTYTLGAYFRWDYTVKGDSFRIAGNAEYDFLFQGATTLAPREVVKQENCNQCHQDLRAHGGARKDVKLCLLCHTVGSEDGNDPSVAGGTPTTTLSFKVMIHKIHNGEHLPSVQGATTNPDGSRSYGTGTDYVITSPPDLTDFSHVAFPVWPSLNTAMPKDLGYSALPDTARAKEDEIRRGVVDCNKCHGDNGSGAPAQGALAYIPSRQACGACHDDISWGDKYIQNDPPLGMPAQTSDAACTQCHHVSGAPLDVQDAHRQPLDDTTLISGVNFALATGTSVSGGSGTDGNFLAGDSPSITFTLKKDDGTDLALASLDAASAVVVGPTSNRQIVMPYPGPNSVAISPYDFVGRLAGSSTTGKAAMSRVLPDATTAVTETLTVEFSSATAFGVTGSVSGNLGAFALPASPSTNPSGSSIGSIDLTPAAVQETVTVDFFSDVDFTVTGSVSGDLGNGKLPYRLNSSVRFESPQLSFTVTVGTTAFDSTNFVYLAIFKGAVANPVLFAIVAGRTSMAATDRLYYEFKAPAPNYTLTIPMDLALEYLGDGDGNIDQTLTAGNLPVYFGRQTLYEVTAVALRTNLSAAAKSLDRYVDVVSTANFAVNDYCVLEGAAAVGTREYVQVGYVENATRMWFKTPLRYAHAAASTADEPTLTFRQEGLLNRYTLNEATGVVTSKVAFGAGTGIVMTYRTDGRFGYLRHAGDVLQANYAPPHNDSPSLGQDWGEWRGLPFADGTYTVSIWGAQNLNVPLAGEFQQYRAASTGINVDFLYGSASEIEPYGFISSSENCYACHNKMLFHGGGRSGFDTCLLCHGVAGAEDWPQYNAPSGTNPTAPNNGVTINFRTMLHKIHKGEELANASTYTVYGNGASPSMYSEVVFPAMPNGVKNCTMCHGTANAWKEPSNRDYPDTTSLPAREWRAVCNACHDSDAATAHIDAQTAPSGEESCAICHGPDQEWSVEIMHKSR